MKQYISFFKLRFTAGLQYRTAAASGLATQLFFGFVSILVYMAFYNSGDSYDVGISIEQLTTYIWLNQAFFTLVYMGYCDNDLIKMIRNGDIAYELCRPSNLYLMWFTRILSSKLSKVLLRGIPLLVIASILPEPYHIIYPDIKTILLYIVVISISAILITAIIVLMYVISFYLLDENGIMGIFSTISDILSGQTIPLALLPKTFGYIVSFLPFAYISDFAFRIFCKNITGIAIIKGLIIDISWLIIIIFIGIKLTDKILKRVVVQGG